MKELDQEKIDRIKREFDYFDSDGSGKMSLEEFRELFKVLAPDSKRREADAGFAEIDADSSGSIEFDEFLQWWQTNWLVY